VQSQRRADPDVRQHLRPRPRLGRRRKRGQENQALGRSRGGYGTKIHVKCDLEGHPLDFHLTANQASDTKQFEILLDSDPDVTPRGVIADKGYDAASHRAAARHRGAVPIIPYRKNTKGRTRFFPKKLYKLRARVEQFIGKLKRFKRVAMRCEKTATNFAAFVALACVFVLVKSVHRA
jgi:transposase